MMFPRLLQCTLAICLLSVAACSTGNAPKTYPVTGKVLRKDGSPFPGGAIEFRPKAKLDGSVLGEIDEKGSFAMRSLIGTHRLQGVPEGEYDVTINPASTDQTVQPITWTKTVTVRADGKNDIVIQLE